MSELGKRLNIGGVDFYLAEPVDRLLTEALGLARMALIRYSYMAGNEDEWAGTDALREYKAAQRFVEEYQHD